tara:strand:+ start:288 stop:614 length:327 start_codon:yes stop_codon:yes gene_type:complete
MQSFKHYLLNEYQVPEEPEDLPSDQIPVPIPWPYWWDFMPYWTPHPILIPVPVDERGKPVSPPTHPDKEPAIPDDWFPDEKENPYVIPDEDEDEVAQVLGGGGDQSTA